MTLAADGQAVRSKPVLAAPEDKRAGQQLVYSSPSDTVHFHTSTHFTARVRRTAFSQDAARARGLKPCPVCLKQQ
jgi:hypothetical protein